MTDQQQYHDPGTLALIAKYPSLGRAIETGIESHDHRELSLLAFLTTHPSLPSLLTLPQPARAQGILNLIDEYSFTKDFLISVGPHKASILSSLVEKQKSKVVVELGGYLGYSAILFAAAMLGKEAKEGGRVWSIELNSDFASIARQIIDLSGLSACITVLVGEAATAMTGLKSESKVTSVDLLFLDHAEDLYVQDFEVAEGLDWLKSGSVVVADNVVRPGAPLYREMVRAREGVSSEGVRGLIQPGDLEDELEVSYVL